MSLCPSSVHRLLPPREAAPSHSAVAFGFTAPPRTSAITLFLQRTAGTLLPSSTRTRHHLRHLRPAIAADRSRLVPCRPTLQLHQTPRKLGHRSFFTNRCRSPLFPARGRG